ncbi:endosomal transmembrane epsin interactor 1 isoform X4 [Antechinus flavipes]|uniref:endosomal transmembrane epsin interactor 1 isoform X4 n=1 Tax=Antechinus flavipes TaxID=38775 RepID=UPI002235C2D0|nr:endosomal transmembrane epsin interactor 1 isoform X4 [Antechinus flavipes]
MSLPVVLPGSCCPVAGLCAGTQAGGPSNSATMATAAREPPLAPLQPRLSRAGLQPTVRPRCAVASATSVLSPLQPPLSSRRAASAAAGVSGSGLLPARPLLSLGLLQLILGCCMVALSFGALSLSSSPQVKNSCPFWAGSSVILSGIIGLTTWKRPMILLKVLFALCALNALTTTVCLVAAALRYLQIFATRRPCIDESQISTEEIEGHGRIPDLEDFIPPVPPPPYFATFYSCTPRLNHRPRVLFTSSISAHHLKPNSNARKLFLLYHSPCRMVGPDVIPLPHIYGARIKGVEVFCPLDPPPPYEAVVNQINQEQGTSFQSPEASEVVTGSLDPGSAQVSQGGDVPNTPGEESPSLSTPDSNLAHLPSNRKALQPLRARSKSDPLLHHLTARGPVLSCEAATQTEIRPELAPVNLRKGLRTRAVRARPHSLIDYKSYIDTKLLVAKFLEQSSCSMTPDIHELVENIKSVLKSDEEHMEEAITSASFLEQIMTPAQPSTLRIQILPYRRYPGLLHLESCGDLSTFVSAESQRVKRRVPRTDPERPHSLIGVVKETVL